MSESKDNVKVVIRVRPLNDSEAKEGARNCVHSSAQSISIDTKHFTYDYVADETISQQDFFQEVGHPIALSCLSGYNGSIFAYGQTGAGKTFTIQGQGSEDLAMCEQRGLLPRCFECLFNEVGREECGGTEYLIKCSYLEIYQEQVMDLLGDSAHCLQLREDIKRGVYVDGLIEETVGDLVATYELLRLGAQNRHVGSTAMNEESSRSHSVFTLVIESKTVREGLASFKSSRFHLIDLAGSERQRATDAAGDRLKEAGMINKSLSALGNVINSLVDLAEGKSRHIHYRDSKLTFLLKDSLSGNSKTCIIANISPSGSAYGETLSTLKFAARAKQITNKAVVNEDTAETLDLLKEQIRKLKEELKRTGPACSLCGGKDNRPQLESLLDHNTRLRQETEKYLNNEVRERDKIIIAFQHSTGKLEKKIATDKMTLKFRDAAIAKHQGRTTEDLELGNLRSEITALREQLETNPVAAKLFVENSSLKQEIQRLEGEMNEDPGTLGWRNKELNELTAKLSEQVKQYSQGQSSTEELVLVKLQYGEDLNAANESFRKKAAKYTDRIELLERQVRELTQNSLVLQEELDSHLSMSNEENLLPTAGELDEILNKANEQQASDQVELLNKAKSQETLKLEINTLTEKNAKNSYENQKLHKELKRVYAGVSEEAQKKALEIEALNREIEALKPLKNELTNVLQETANLTESLEQVTSQAQDLHIAISEKDQQIEALHTQIANLTWEHRRTIEALQDPATNSSLARVFSENATLKKELANCQRENQQLLISIETAQSHTKDLLKAKQDSLDSLTSHCASLKTAHSTQTSALSTQLTQLELSAPTSLKCNEKDLAAAREEIASLKAENTAKVEILKNTNKNILATRNEINMWKKCIDEKNAAIQELRNELKKKDQETFLLHSKLDCLDGGNEPLELALRERGLSHKKPGALHNEVKSLKEELKRCLEDRESLTDQIKRLRGVTHREAKDYQGLYHKLKEEKNKLLKQLKNTHSESQEVLSLAKITDFISNATGVEIDPKETGLAESTVKAISGLCQRLQVAQTELSSLRAKQEDRKESANSHKTPLAHYHALLQASAIKPGKFLPQNGKHRQGYK